MFRINYGNGQVSGTYSDSRKAKRDLAQARKRGDLYSNLFYVQFCDGDGEWVAL
jgi:hypothetical protein